MLCIGELAVATGIRHVLALSVIAAKQAVGLACLIRLRRLVAVCLKSFAATRLSPACGTGMVRPMALSRFVFDVTADNFPMLVLENSDRGPVLVNYWSPRAGPCFMLMPRLVRLCTECGGRFLLAMLNTDEFGALARSHGVYSLPTIKVFRGGRVIDTLHGAESDPVLRRFIDKHVAPATATPVLRAVAQAYGQGEIAQATSLAAKAALTQPEDPRLAVNVAKLLMQQENYTQAFDLLSSLPAVAQEDGEVMALLSHLGFIVTAARAPERALLEQAIADDPDDVDARYALSARLVTVDDYDGAMAQLLEIVRRDRTSRREVGRKGLISLFGLLGAGHPLTTRYRPLLQAALN